MSVCTLCILPLLWRMINISLKCHFSSRPVYSSFYIKELRWAAPSASVLAETQAHMHSSGHRCTGKYSLSCDPVPFLLPQLTQLGRHTALRNSPNYPAAPYSVQLPQWAMLIYNGAYVTGSSITTLHCSNTHTLGHTWTPHHRKACIPLYVCLSCWWVPSSKAVSQLGWFSLKAPACCLPPILISQC